MARNENPLDPSAGPIAAFAADLRTLRHEAGHMTYRVMAKRTGYSVSTLSVAASGASLPSLEVTLAYVQACGGDPQAWQERWHRIARQRQQKRRQQQVDHGINGRSVLISAPPAEREREQEQEHVGRRAARRARSSRRSRRTGFWAAGVTLEAGLLVFALFAMMYGHAFNPPPPAASTRAPSTASTSAPLNSAVSNEPSPGRCTTMPPPSGSVAGKGPWTGQDLPGQVEWPTPSGIPALLPQSTFVTNYSPTLTQVSAYINSGSSADYTAEDALDGARPVMTLNLATPKIGTISCLRELIYDAEELMKDGRQDTSATDIVAVDAGPHLAAAHAIVVCSDYYVPLGIPTTCAWAGPITGSGTPFFGQYSIHAEPSGPPQQYLATPTSDYADQLFAALTG